LAGWPRGLIFPRQVLIRGGRALQQSEQKESQGRGMELGAELAAAAATLLYQ